MMLLEQIDQFSGIATALVAALAYGHYRYGKFQRRKKLNAFLQKYPDRKFSIPYSMGHLHMTEAEIFQAAFGNPSIKFITTSDNVAGLASELRISAPNKSQGEKSRTS